MPISNEEAKMELHIAKCISEHMNKLKDDLPVLMKPVIYEVSENTLSRTMRLLGVDITNQDSVNRYRDAVKHASDLRDRATTDHNVLRAALIRIMVGVGCSALLVKLGITIGDIK